jgi:SAM-dependent methyltransferase
MVDSQKYLLGMEPAEVRRLEQQHSVWRGLTNRVWDLAGFGAGQTLIDFGSGPGFTSVELAYRVGESGRVIAVDSSGTATDQLRTMTRQKGIENVEVITADASNFDPSPWRPDGLFARWLFCFLRAPELIVRRVSSALGPGAVVAVMDYWNYLAIRMEPSNHLFTKVFRAVYDSFGSLDVAGRLPALFEAAGLNVTQVEPLCQVGQPGSLLWRWLAEFQQLYLPTLVRKGYLTGTELKEYDAWWREQEEDKTTVLFAPPLLGVIAIKQ